MIEKKDGSINECIYYQTIYNNSKNAIYPTIINLKFIIKKICEIDSTTKYIKFNPFYKNSRLDCQIEFDEYMFYMECRDDLTESDLEEHWTRCMDNIYDVPHKVKQFKDMNEWEKKQAQTLYPICKNGDYKSYHKFLCNYERYLDELIPILFKKVIQRLSLNQDDMAFGYFCFEVHSG